MLAFLQHAELKTFPLMEQVLRGSCAQEGTFVDSGANVVPRGYKLRAR